MVNASTFGFEIYGAAEGDSSGNFVSGAGDINDDGLLDFIICAADASALNRTNSGITYVVYGAVSVNGEVQEDMLKAVDLATFNATQGFKIIGADADDKSCSSASYLGDVNGDSIDDIVIGAHQRLDGEGAAYVIFGRSAGNFSDIDLANMTSDVGIEIFGGGVGAQVGWSVAGGDVDNDGLNDIIIGAPGSASSGSDGIVREEVGRVYVIFGSHSLAASNLSMLQSPAGCTIFGNNSGDRIGYSVSAGDINGDNLADLFISSRDATVHIDTDTRANAGVVYVLNGAGVGVDVNLNEPFDGFSVLGASNDSQAGYVVSALGDVNYDGFNDFIVLAREDDFLNSSVSVFFGGSSFSSDIDMASFSPFEGIRIFGGDGIATVLNTNSRCGVFDFNGDGIADIAVGAEDAERPLIGVIFGNA